MTRAQFLDRVRELVLGERNRDYGDPADNHDCAAKMIAAYLSRRNRRNVMVDGRDVTWIQTCVKASRDAYYRKADNPVDAAGYLAGASECAPDGTPQLPEGVDDGS